MKKQMNMRLDVGFNKSRIRGKDRDRQTLLRPHCIVAIIIMLCISRILINIDVYTYCTHIGPQSPSQHIHNITILKKKIEAQKWLMDIVRKVLKKLMENVSHKKVTRGFQKLFCTKINFQLHFCKLHEVPM